MRVLLFFLFLGTLTVKIEKYMTIIYSNFGDRDCSDLPPIWQDLPDVKVVEIIKGSIWYGEEDDWHTDVDKAIAEEKDFILFCGHGTPNGLLAPNWGDMVLDEHNLNLIEAKSVVGIWCNASTFAVSHKISGFFSSMFVSNLGEAHMVGIQDTTPDSIAQNVKRFSTRVNQLIKSKVPVSEWQANLSAQVDLDDPVEVYNYQGLQSLLFG